MLTKSQKDKLVLDHMSQIRGIAGHIIDKLHVPFELDELISYGVQGLLEAADRYDGKSGASLSTFAFYRIRGAMFDGLRNMGWLTRREYTRYRAEVAADQFLEGLAEEDSLEETIQAANGQVADESDSESIEQTLEDVSQALAGVAAIFVTSLEASSSLPEQLTPPEACAEYQLLDDEKRKTMLQALATLPERERRLIELYYLKGKTLDDAGAQLGLSKSWACRLHTRAVGLLRDALERPEKSRQGNRGKRIAESAPSTKARRARAA